LQLSPSRASDYRAGLADYRAFVRSTPCGAQTSDLRIEHQFECLEDWSLVHSLSEVEAWFEAQRRACTMVVTEIGLNETAGWIVAPQTGNVGHVSHEFFTVHGIRVTETASREVGAKGWCQPILTQVGYDGGLLGILRRRLVGVPHYLIEAKAEPGNYEKLQLSPTLQATFSNLKRAHEGQKPRFAEYFETPEQVEGTVLYRAWLSEDGGRLYLKRNLGMLVEVPESREITVPPGFIWLSMYQIKELLCRNAWVNPHIRGIIAHL
jgi:oxidase EvaA